MSEETKTKEKEKPEAPTPEEPKPETEGPQTEKPTSTLKPGTVLAMPREQFHKFLEDVERRSKKKFDHLRCGHSRNNLNVRTLVLHDGLSCLDCRVRQLNKDHPR